MQIEIGEMEMIPDDWYEATVLGNDVIGSSFVPGEPCVFRSVDSGYAVFNLKNAYKEITPDVAKGQLRSVRDGGKLVRARDQGHINWNFSRSKLVE